MLKRLKFKSKAKLESELVETDAKLALLNVKLAAQHVQFARQTHDLAPLFEAEETLAKARKHFTFEECPPEIVMVTQGLADTWLSLGQAQKNVDAVSRARDAYRSAITLASMLGDEDLRTALRRKLKTTDRLLGLHPQTPSLFKVA